jgi:hypothetical protein
MLLGLKASADLRLGNRSGYVKVFRIDTDPAPVNRKICLFLFLLGVRSGSDGSGSLRRSRLCSHPLRFTVQVRLHSLGR